jgi:hypothetical protein
VVGVGWYVIAVAALHFLDTDFDPVNDYISEYALGDYGWLMKSASFAVGLGTLALAMGFRRSLEPSRRVIISVILMTLAGIGFIVAGLFNADPILESGVVDSTPVGIVHQTVSILSFLSLIVTAFLLRGVFARNEPWQSLSRPALWFAIVLLLSMIILSVVPLDGPVGLPQRVFLALMMTWLTVVGLRMRQLESSETEAVRT